MDKFILTCFGIDAEVLERLCEEFDLDWSEEDVFDCFKNVDYSRTHCNWGAAINLLDKTLEKIIEKYEDDADADDFDYDFSSPSFPHFYYKDKPFKTTEELEELINNKLNKGGKRYGK